MLHQLRQPGAPWGLGPFPHALINVSVCWGRLYDVCMGGLGAGGLADPLRGIEVIFDFACLFIYSAITINVPEHIGMQAAGFFFFSPLLRYSFLQINNREKEDPQDQRMRAFEGSQENQPQDFGDLLHGPEFNLRASSSWLIATLF